jgi:glycerate dehydrogenase
MPDAARRPHERGDADGAVDDLTRARAFLFRRLMEIIVFLERDTLRAEVRRPSFEHVWRDYGSTRPEEVFERLEGATVAVVNKLPLRADVLARLPTLRLIAVAATGTDNIDLDFCRERGINVSNVRGYARDTLPEHVLMLTLALRRNLLAYVESVRAGEWQRAGQFCLHAREIRDLHGSTLGLVGHGTLGRGVERLARAFGMEVLIAERKTATDVREGRTLFAEVVARADVLSLHVPLADETRNMIGREEFALMKPSAVLINCARGGVVDERALAKALREGELAGAGVDVLSVEPPREDNPLLAANVPNLILTPHVAWAGRDAQQALADQLIENIEAFVFRRKQ